MLALHFPYAMELLSGNIIASDKLCSKSTEADQLFCLVHEAGGHKHEKLNSKSSHAYTPSTHQTKEYESGSDESVRDFSDSDNEGSEGYKKGTQYEVMLC